MLNNSIEYVLLLYNISWYNQSVFDYICISLYANDYHKYIWNNSYSINN